VLAGELMQRSGSAVLAWQIVFGFLAAAFVALAIYHLWAVPKPESDCTNASGQGVLQDFMHTFKTFFLRRDIALVLAFLLTYRLGEAQALKLVSPFLLDARAQGGLGLSTSQVGFVYGTVGVAALTVGGILGGLAIARRGLKFWLWPMMLCVHVPNLAFVALAYLQPASLSLVTVAIAIEQLGYGFGFAAYMLFMIMVADGPHKTAHYAICTGFMALGMMLPGMVSGWIQEQLGYPHFFVWVCVCTLPSLIVALYLKIDPAFGKKAEVTQ
jgi:PAT family beta-lactamase induction signal transducer AmpG